MILMRPFGRLRRFSFVTAATAVFLAALAVSALAQGGGRSRVVVIGDIHGAYDNLVEILRRAELIDDTGRWTGGTASLVQLGDFMDRGAGVRRVMDLFIGLEARARIAGGEIAVLLGNHEVMNLLADTRDVTPEIFASFADAQSEVRRAAAYEAYEKLASARLAARPQAPAVYRKTREEWMAAHPPGFIEYREALSPRGEYGQWLRSKPAVRMIGDTILMHAGLNPDQAPNKLDDVNKALRDEIKRYDASIQRLVDRHVALPFFTLQEVLELSNAELEAAVTLVKAARWDGREADLSSFDNVVLQGAQEIVKMGSWSALAPEGPMWFRGYAYWDSNAANRERIDKLFARYRAKHIVVGHTPVKSGTITGRFGGRVFLIDTGMLNSYYAGGQPAALEMTDGRFLAIYKDKRVPLSGSDDPAARER